MLDESHLPDMDWCMECWLPYGLGHCLECVRQASALYGLRPPFRDNCEACDGHGCRRCQGRGYTELFD